MKRCSPPDRPRRRRAAAAILAAGLLAILPAPALAWPLAHADAANSGFADVRTAPAGRNSLSIPNLGSFAPGAGPAIAPDGTVYLGNEQGRLFAFRADGTPLWQRDLPGGQAILASPAIGRDGAIYVVGVASHRDHRTDPPTVHPVSTLHKFLPGGGWAGQAPFPEHYSGLRIVRSRGATSAPPNIWSDGTTEAAMLPAIYRAPNGYELRLLAFSTGGALLADSRVLYVQHEITAETDWGAVICSLPPYILFCALGVRFDFPHGSIPDVVAPLPGVAIGGGLVIVSDNRHDVIGYRFAPETGFVELFRKHDGSRTLRSPPTYLPDGQSAVGTGDGYQGAVRFVTGDPAAALGPVAGLGAIAAAPTVLPERRIAVVEGFGGATVLRRLLAGYAVEAELPVTGLSIAAAAASRTHLFVATADALHSFDIRNYRPVGRFPWVGGGRWPPAIGPQGHVYAMASDILFIFPPPRPCIGCPDFPAEDVLQ